MNGKSSWSIVTMLKIMIFFSILFHFILSHSIKEIPVVTQQIDSITHTNGLQPTEGKPLLSG